MNVFVLCVIVLPVAASSVMRYQHAKSCKCCNCSTNAIPRATWMHAALPLPMVPSAAALQLPLPNTVRWPRSPRLSSKVQTGQLQHRPWVRSQVEPQEADGAPQRLVRR